MQLADVRHGSATWAGSGDIGWQQLAELLLGMAGFCLIARVCGWAGQGEGPILVQLTWIYDMMLCLMYCT
jgi:hypothetical protein